jgi:hypothetical protein
MLNISMSSSVFIVLIVLLRLKPSSLLGDAMNLQLSFVRGFGDACDGLYGAF